MKKAQIIHNPGAGKGDYSKEELVAILKSHGYKCGYSSTKEKGWKKIDDDVDFLVVAGGDGTVRKVALKILSQREKTLPLALLPLGTANNISKALSISGHPKEIISSISQEKIQPFDTGKIKGSEHGSLFIESYGYGIFPALMKDMKDNPPDEPETPEEEIKIAQQRVHEIIQTFPAEQFEITIDDREYHGTYIMVEVMNISSIGPNLGLSPNSNPNDGEFEVVLIPESQRAEFAAYAESKMKGGEKGFIPKIVKGGHISIASASPLLHIDDELIEAENSTSVEITADRAMLEFLVQ